MHPDNAFEDFQRDISYRISRCPEGIALTATMKDVFHDVFLEIIVDDKTLRIESALVNFLRQPTDYCQQIDKSMSLLVGTVIGKGLNKRLIEIFGGSEGCGNIRTMLMGLLPLALNAKAAIGIKDRNEMLEKISKELTGTCIGYPSNY
jgi:hypothetical protein